MKPPKYVLERLLLRNFMHELTFRLQIALSHILRFKVNYSKEIY